MNTLLGRAWSRHAKLNATLILLIVSALVALLAVVVVTAIQSRQAALSVAQAALRSEHDARVEASRQISEFLAQERLLERDALANGAQLAVLREQVTLLQAQVRSLGGQPVVEQTTPAGGSSRSPRPGPSPHPSPRTSASPSPSRSPHPSPSPTVTCVPLVPLCYPT